MADNFQQVFTPCRAQYVQYIQLRRLIRFAEAKHQLPETSSFSYGGGGGGAVDQSAQDLMGAGSIGQFRRKFNQIPDTSDYHTATT